MSEATTRAAFVTQAAFCRMNGAPFMAALCTAIEAVIDRSTPVGVRILDWPGDAMADALVMRLTGGLNALVRGGALPDLAVVYPPNTIPAPDELARRLARALADDRLLPWLDVPPQTNEVARSAALMPGLMTIAAATGLPLRLFELGASAGLNLRLDAYGYDFDGLIVGPVDAPVVLKPEWVGPSPPGARVTVVARRGVDIAPVDLRDADARARLLAFVWPEQTARVVRLEAAIAAFLADPAPVDRADAAAWVETHVSLQQGVATVVLHSIAFQYFPGATKARIAAHLATMGTAASVEAPLAWLRLEMDDPTAPALPTLRLTSWPGGEERLLAHAHPHGSSIRWLG